MRGTEALDSNMVEFTDLYENLARTYDGYKVFDGFLDYALDHFNDARSESTLASIFKSLSITEAPEVFEKMFLALHRHHVRHALEDPLGDFFEKRFARPKMDQYFSPPGLASLLARLSGLSDDQSEFGKIIVEPNVGSGRILLQAAEISRKYLLFGADLSAMCCKIATINMLMNLLMGEISNMNTRTGEFFGVYITFARQSGNLLIPKFIYSSDPAKSVLLQSMLQTSST